VVDRFETVTFAEVDFNEFEKAPKALKMPRWGKPEMAFAEMPDTVEERNFVLFAAVDGVDLNRLFRYYKPVELALPQIVKRARPIQELMQFNEKSLVNEKLVPFGTQSISYLPVSGPKKDLTAIVETSSGKLLSVVDLRPWPDGK
jgi:hypothetical protein